MRTWGAWKQQVEAKRRAEVPIVPCQVMLAKQISGVCCQYHDHIIKLEYNIIKLEITGESDRKSYTRLLIRHSVYSTNGTLSIGISSQTENSSMIIFSQSIKLWSTKCLYILHGK